jgi:hypothetical protein
VEKVTGQNVEVWFNGGPMGGGRYRMPLSFYLDQDDPYLVLADMGKVADEGKEPARRDDRPRLFKRRMPLVAP